MTFQQKLDSAIEKNNSLLSVGFDPILDKIPLFLRDKEDSVFEFSKAIIDNTHDLVCAYKFNSAFYEATGDKGIKQLKVTCDYLRKNYPEIPIILDFKRADIESSNTGYINYAFNYIGADAVTLNPYVGKVGLQPFLEIPDKGMIIWCKSSNNGSGEFQDLLIDNKPLYQIVAENVAKDWNKLGNCLLVVGATYPNELAEIRKIVGDMTLLVPGVGTQGGNVEAMLKTGLNSQKKGLIIVVVRSIIYAANDNTFAKAARNESEKLRDEINKYRV